MKKKGKLYLIPTTLGASPLEDIISKGVKDTACEFEYFIVENIRTSRRYLSKLGMNKPIRELEFTTLNKHSLLNKIDELLAPIDKGHNIGLLSEAGCPGIADPGAELVSIAHRRNIDVVPMVGPSSILLALIGSGMNGQNFTFHGYLPKDRRLRIKAMLSLETQLESKDQTHIFIEAPFRNKHLLYDIVNNCKPETLLCIATDLTLDTEFIKTKTIAEWKEDQPKIEKRPTVFLMGKWQ